MMEKENHTKETSSILSGARYIAETLRGYGVTHIFYVEAILRRMLVEAEALGIKRVLTHSEKAAAYMADGYARVSHRPGVCLAQSVGAANLASGLQDAYLGLSPVIAMTGKAQAIVQYRNAYQEIDHRPLFMPVTKYHASVDIVEQLPYLLRQAFREVTSGAPGPAHLDLVDNLGRLIEEARTPLKVVIEEAFMRIPSHRPEPQKGHVRAAVLALEKSSKPVIIAGGGVVASSAEGEVVELAEKLQIPVATSLNGKGTIPEDHPLSLGVVGSYSRWCANQVVSEADLVLFIGSHTSDQVTNAWTVPRIGTPVIQVDIDPSELGRNYSNTVPIMGDAKVTVQRLLECIDDKKAKPDWAKYAAEKVNKWRHDIEPFRYSDAMPIRPERLCKELSEALPSDSVLVTDTGYAAIWSGTQIYMNHPGQSFIRAAGSLGWAFPAALGAKCAAPNRPVICLIGDGGFWYHLSELETAARCGIHTITVVNNNSCLSQTERGVRLAYGERPGRREELFKFKEVNFTRIACEMGCKGFRVERPEEISKVLAASLNVDAPVVVEVITDPEIKAPDPWKPS